MPSIIVESEHVSAGCNCTYNSFEIPDDSLVVYGANHALVFYDLEEEKVVKTAVVHGGRVNCVRSVKDIPRKALVSCASDGSVVLWKEDEGPSVGYSPVVHDKIQKCSITVIDAIQIEPETVLIGCITALSKVILLRLDESAAEKRLEIFQEFDLKLSVALDICFYNFKTCETSIVLAFGMDNGSIILHTPETEQLTNLQFKQKVHLKKHEDWVRCLTFGTYNNDILLAAGGEDYFISIWRFVEAELEAGELEFQVHKLGKYSIVLDSMVIGHEGWINSLHWNQAADTRAGGLVSCSSDQSIIIWDKIDSSWSEKYRFGTIGGDIPGGFGAKSRGKFVATCGFHGAIQIWKAEDPENDGWTVKPSVTGHFGPISDLDYNPGGQYVITTSVDQTTRIHSPWGENRWHEIGRPQIHGHDLFTAKCLGDYIVSGAEEKILRAFQPTEIFVRNLENASEICADFLEHVVPAASLPALGLSNQSESKHATDGFDIDYYKTLSLNSRLDEDFLRSQTLWPELSKLYGHVYEICCIATASKHALVASGSQATKQQYAAIILWSATDWKNLGEFRFHNLNVTDLEFSKSENRLLSSSRDRTWALWEVVSDSTYSLKFLESGNFHTRALWVGTWATNDSFFATGGRDKKLAIWTNTNADENTSSKYQVVASQTFTASVSSASINSKNLIAVGLESGLLHLYLVNFLKETGIELSHMCMLDHSLSHHGTIQRLRFNPKKDDELASAGADKFFRVYKIFLS